MKLSKLTLSIAFAGLAVLAGCAASTGTPPVDVATASESGTWTWRYRVYNITTGDEWPSGRIELSGRPGDYRFRYLIKEPNPCAMGSVPAAVTTDADHTIIIPAERMTGCGARRFTIRKDGAGGRVETRVQPKKGAATWELEEHERGLTAM